MAVRIPTSFFVSSKGVLRSFSNVGITSNKCKLVPHLTSHFNGRHVLHNCVRCASSDNKKDVGAEIYDGPLSSRIRAVKFFSFSSSIMGLACQPFLFEKVIEDGHNIGVIIFSGVIIQFFTFATPLMFHYVGKRYVRKIYYNEESDEYTALTYSFFARDKLLRFKRDDVVAPDVPGLFTTWIVKGTPLFVEASHFDNMEHYKKLMGFDKPIDFKLGENPVKE